MRLNRSFAVTENNEFERWSRITLESASPQCRSLPEREQHDEWRRRGNAVRGFGWHSNVGARLALDRFFAHGEDGFPGDDLNGCRQWSDVFGESCTGRESESDDFILFVIHQCRALFSR